MNDKNKTELDHYLVGMIAVQIVIAFVIGELIWLIFGLSMPISLLIGVAVWSILLLGTNLVNAFFFEVIEFHGAVLINQFIHDLPPSGDDATKLRNLRSMREVGTGYHGKWPWERINTIDMKRHIVIGAPIKCYTRDNIEVTVDYVDTLSPLSGYLAQYLWWGDEARRKFFESLFQGLIISTTKQVDEKDLFGQIEVNGQKHHGIQLLKNAFGSVLGGEDKVDDIEKRYGTFTNRPSINSVTRPKAYNDAAQSVLIAERTNEAIEKLAGRIGKNLATAMVAGSQGISNVRTIQIVGSVEGLEKLTALVLPSASDLFGEPKDKQQKG